MHKLVICIIAGLICGETFLRIGDRFLSFILPIPLVIGTSGLIVVASLVYAFIWHWHNSNKSSIDTFWIGAIRYGIAFDLATFGLQKIFHLQFSAPLGMLDEPLSSFSSEWLTWTYFNRSYGFACVIGGSQIIGSMLLLFNRTRLLGVIFQIPILLNIIFIDYFYELDFGVLVHAIILFAGIIYLLRLDFHRLVEFFIQHKPDFSIPTSTLWKNVGRVSILIIPLLLILKHGSRDKHPGITGKYEVIEMKVNGKPALAASCSDSLLTLAYFDMANDFVFEFNSQQRRMFGLYDLDESSGNMSIAWHYPAVAKDKSFEGHLNVEGNNQLTLNGKLAGDVLEVRLKRVITQHSPWH